MISPSAIPHILHHIWLGPNLMPEKFQEYRNGWQEKHPGWQFHLWTDDHLPPMINRDIFDRVKTYSEKSDVLRMELLYRYGGVYVDTDVECLKNIEPLLEGERCVLARMTDRAICPAFMASAPGDPYLATCIGNLPAHLASRPRDTPTETTGPFYMQRFMPEFSHLKVLEPHLVFPYEPRTPKAKRLWDSQGAAAFPDSYAAHHWEGSWVKKKKTRPPLFEVGQVDMKTEQVVIVGRGPSLAGFDFQQLANLPESVTVICVNQAIEKSPRADVWFTLDPSAQVQKLMKTQRPGTRYFAAVPGDFGRKRAKCPAHRHGVPKGVTYLHRISGKGPQKSKWGLSDSPQAIYSGNSGCGALQLATLMGAKKIVLLGIDGADDGQDIGKHFDSPQPTCNMTHLPRLFASTVKELKAEGVEVVNGSPHSKVTCFPRCTPEAALQWLGGKSLTKALLFNDTTSERHYGCDAVMQSLHALLPAADIYVSQSHRCGYTDRIRNKDIRALLQDIDVVVVNGEGSIHHNNRRARGLARIGSLAAGAGIKSALVNATVYDISPAILEQLRKFDYICVRDYASQQVLAQAGVQADLCPDLTFYNDWNISPPQTARGVRVSDSVVPEVTEQLQALAHERGWPQRSIRHPRGKGQVKPYVMAHAQQGGVVTGRFHDVCFCVNSRTPFLAVESNTNKIEALLCDVFANTGRLLAPEALAGITQVPPFTQEELQAIDRYKKSAVEKFNHLRTRLKQLV